jgi:hypothetical protein
MQTSGYGHFVEIPLPPGSYTVNGTFLGATSNGVHPKKTESVIISPGHTVRQDFFLSIWERRLAVAPARRSM